MANAKWQDFEEEVRYIYSTLLNLRDEGVIVSRNAVLVGRSGSTHQIDIFWEFSRAGVRHRVAIECKNLSRPVEKGQIQEFHSKLSDLDSIVGIVVSRNGFQSGALGFAKHYGIQTLTLADLPHLGQLLALRINAVALPDEHDRGEPFWAIMKIRQDRVTGSYFATKSQNGAQCVPLFYSKQHAKRGMMEAKLSFSQWAVRGLPRATLRAFALMLEPLENRGGGAQVLFLPPGAREDAVFLSLPVTKDILLKEYVV